MTKSKFLSYVVNLAAAAAVFLAFHLLFSSGTVSRSYRDLFTLGCIFSIAAVSLNLSTGLLGELCLGHAGFMSVGAYTSALVTIAFKKPGDIPILLLSLIIGGLLAAISGIIVGIPALRLRGDYLAITTLAFGEIVKVVVRALKITGGGQPMTGISLTTNYTMSYWILILTIIIIYTLIRSRHGRAILSIREDDIAAEASGVAVTRYKLLAFSLSAFFAGVAGGLYAHYQGVLEPQFFDYNQSINFMVMVVLGGIGSLTGSVISAFFLTLLPEILRGLAVYRTLIYSVVLVLLMLYRPEGLLGQKELSQRLFARLLGRNGLRTSPQSGVGGSSASPQENIPVSGTAERKADSAVSDRLGTATGAPEEALERKWKGRR
ncbi:MAG: branched-chain amino acid ABC transporter permease [Saccharofermentanales bacterium]|jgi:branched-chain amino acid transport system permease protein|nr:branched-chain amino acid ABC transporter permease [Bacillota bacterium]